MGSEYISQTPRDWTEKQKIKNEQSHQFIQAVWGRGYQFVEEKD